MGTELTPQQKFEERFKANEPRCPECGEETYADGCRCDDCIEAEIERDDDDRLCEQHARLECPECRS